MDLLGYGCNYMAFKLFSIHGLNLQIRRIYEMVGLE